MEERVAMWKEDYPHLAADPVGMVQKLLPLKPLVGKECLERWMGMAEAGEIDALFEAVMTEHYDPCYVRSTRRNYGVQGSERVVKLPSLRAEVLGVAVRSLSSASQAG